ncbi:hypothetical protein [Actinomadura kijaniata]|uniref:hypothetical protein n=1 Tax=Actinomadura kijaniata TaxID=46161 RepID=UPI000AEC6412|nr:hypothetical protein [Actinomadura kijaniata]
MTEPLAPPTSPSPEAPARSRTRSRWLWFLVVGWAAQVLVRIASARGQVAPFVQPDESGYLVAARWLTGGPGADLSGSAFYQPGYSLLLVPAHLLADDPGTVYRLVLVTNALVGAAAFPLAFLALLRLGLDRVSAAPLAWSAALLPAASFWGQMAMADSVFTVVVLAWLLCLDRFVRTAALPAAAAANLLACYAYALHGRGAVILAVHAAAMAWHALRRERRRSVVALGMLLPGVGAALAFNSLVRDGLYPGGVLGLEGELWNRLTSWSGQMWALGTGAGQVWALLTATWMIGGVGAVVVVARLAHRDTAYEDRLLAAVLLAATSGVAYLTAAALPDEQRFGNHAYVRYLSCFALVYTLAGLAALVRTVRVARPALVATAVFACLGLLVWARVSRLPEDYGYLGHDFPEVGLLGGFWGGLRPLWTSLTASLLLLLFLGLRRLGPRALATGLLVVNALAMLVITAALARPGTTADVVPPGAPSGGVAIARPFGGHPNLFLIVRARTTFSVWWTELEFFDPRQGPPRPGVCSVVVNWPGGTALDATWPAHPQGWRARGAEMRSRKLRWAVWSSPGCPVRPGGTVRG